MTKQQLITLTTEQRVNVMDAIREVLQRAEVIYSAKIEYRDATGNHRLVYEPLPP